MSCFHGSSMSKREEKEESTSTEESDQLLDADGDASEPVEESHEEVRSDSDIESEADDSNDEKVDPSVDTTEQESTVISKGKASLIISGAEEVRSEASKPKSIEAEPRVIVPVDRDSNAELVESDSDQAEEEIQRLEAQKISSKDRIKVEKAKFEKLENRPDDAELQEQGWGGEVSTGWWVIIAGVSAAALILGGLIIKGMYDGDKVETVTATAPLGPVEVDPHEGSPEKWFHERAGKIGFSASDVLRSYSLADTDVARSQWVRFPEIFKVKSKEREVFLKPRIDQIEEQSWSIDHIEETAFLTLDCKDSEFMPFRAYFVREGEQLKLDWQATTAWSEVGLEEIKKDVKKHLARTDVSQDPSHSDAIYNDPVLVRCLIRRKDEFYAGPYNDKEHSAYMVIAADNINYMWAYTERDSALDLELRELLNHGRFVVDLKKDIRVTIRVMRDKKDALPSQLKLVELLHREWVTP